MTAVMPTACDVAVIGAGLAGALIARQLAQQNLTVAVLEAGEIAAGATGNSAELALLGTPEFYATLEEQRGPAFSTEVWELSVRNLELLAATAQSLGVTATKVGSFRLINSSAEAIIVQRSVQRLTHQGFNVALEDAMELGYLIGLQTFDDLSFDPATMTRRLLTHPRITVQLHTEVQQLQPDGKGIAIHAKRHYLRARAAVLAAGAFSAHLWPALSSQLTMQPVQIVECRVDQPLPVPIVLDQGRVVLHGHDQRWRLSAWGGTTTASLWPVLERYGEQFCPQAVLLRRYTSWVARSLDGLPLVGQLVAEAPLYTLTGLGPWGLSWAFVATQRLLELLLHDEDPGILNIQRLNKLQG